MIHDCTPFSRDKNLARAYNQAFEYPRGGWLILRDIDTMYLTPNTPNLIDDYVSKYAMSDVGIFTCFTNRVGNREQVYANSQRDNDEITTWIKVATALEHQPMKVKQLKTPISGMLMVIAREVATKIKFNEDLKCLGVDTDFSQRVLDAGYSILRMDTVLVWHTYRLLNGVNNKKHLV